MKRTNGAVLVASLAVAGVATIGAPALTGSSSEDTSPDGDIAGSPGPSADGPSSDIDELAEQTGQHLAVDPLGDLGSLNGSIAVLTGEVVDVELAPRDEDGGWATMEINSLTLSDPNIHRPLARTEQQKEDLAALDVAVRLDDRIELAYARGDFEVGQDVAVFVGWWSPDEYSVLFAMDAGRGELLPGFDDERATELTAAMLATGEAMPEAASDDELLQQLSEVADEMNASDAGDKAPTNVLERALASVDGDTGTSAAGGPAEVEEANGGAGSLPQIEELLAAGVDEPAYVEIAVVHAVVGDEPREFALATEGGVGAWFQQEPGSTVTTVSVDLEAAGQALQLRQRSMETSSPDDAGDVVEPEEGDSFVAPDQPGGVAVGVIELAERGPASLTVLSEDEYFEFVLEQGER